MSGRLSGVRGRVVFNVLAVTALLFSVLGTVGFLAVANGGRAEVRDRVTAVVDRLANQLTSGASTVRISTPDGVTAIALDPAAALPPKASSEIRVRRDVTVGGTTIRVLGRASDARLVDGLRALYRALWVGIPIAVAVTAGIAGAATGRALRPVADITRLARDVSAGDATTRVPVPDTGDEIEDLARTMNDMLDRIGQGIAAHRRFTSDAAHELRTPLMALQGELELAATATIADDPDFVARLATQSARLRVRVDDLLLLSALDEAPPVTLAPIRLDEIVRAEVAQIGGDIPTAILGGDDVTVAADAMLVQRAIRNLLTNAQRHAKSAVNVTLTDGDGKVWLHVDDDGPGIAPSERERIFERFSRLDEARHSDAGGAGLGLSIVASVARSHSGGVVAAAGPLGGARLSLWLPSPTAGLLIGND